MLEKLVQQGAQSGREAVLFVVVLEEEVADSAVVGTAPKLFVYQRLRKDRLAASRICRNPEQIIGGADSPSLVQRVRQSPLAGLLDTVGVDILELLVCAGLENLMAVSMFFIEVPHCFVLEVFSRRMRVRFQDVCRYLRLFTQLFDTAVDYILTGSSDLSETLWDSRKDCVLLTISKYLCDPVLLLDSAWHHPREEVLSVGCCCHCCIALPLLILVRV
jgi:hypothetical protein